MSKFKLCTFTAKCTKRLNVRVSHGNEQLNALK